MKKRKKLALLWLLLISFGITGCKAPAAVNPGEESLQVEPEETTVTAVKIEGNNISIEGAGYPYQLTDFLKQQLVLGEKPQRPAILSGTYLNMWYELGGTSVCRTDLNTANLSEAHQEQILALPSVGPVYNANLEAIIAAQPDFIMAQLGSQTGISKTLGQMGYPVITLNMKTYEEVLEHLRVFGVLLENTEGAEALIESMETQKQAILEKLPQKETSVVILYVTASNLSVKLDNSIAGDVAKMLELNNIASHLPPDTLGSETTPLDIEYIVQENPDYVLVTSMISSNEAARATMEEIFSTNPAWSSVEAVREGRVLYLPQEYFLYHAGHEYVQAIEYLAKGIYPEIFGELND